MTDSNRQHDQPSGRPSRRLDRRTFLAGGLRVSGAITAASLGVDALVGADNAPAKRRRPGPYRRTRQPNILVIMVDQLRAPRWFGPGANGADLPPHIAALARSGVSFARHYTPSNDCTPARAAMLTGLYTHQTGCMITGASTLDPGFPTWGTMLREHGYGTWWYGKWHLTHADRRWNNHSGPPALARYGFDGGTYPSPNGAPDQGWRVDPHIADQFEQWYAQAGGDGPWCTTVSFVNPHDIAWWWRWTARSRHEASAPSRVSALPANFETPEQLVARGKPSLQSSLQLTSAESFGAVPFTGPGVEAAWLPFLDLYVQLQLKVDHQIGRVMKALARRPKEMANTIVVFTSDHGEYGASHGLRGKGAGMYEEAIRVPLIVSDHSGTLGLVPNTVRHQLTSGVDLAPLFLTLASGSNGWRSNPRYAHLATRADLAAILRDPAARGRRYALHATDEVLTEFALLPHDAQAPLHVRGIVTPTAKYATYSHWRADTLEPLARGEQTELYDYTTRGGHLEIDNRAGSSPLEDQLRATLEHATRDELHEPLPITLLDAQQRGLTRYQELAQQARRGSDIRRVRAVERIVRRIEHQLP